MDAQWPPPPPQQGGVGPEGGPGQGKLGREHGVGAGYPPAGPSPHVPWSLSVPLSTSRPF